MPGEELPKVLYGLVDAQSYRDRNILVVGGGDSAVEAAVVAAAELARLEHLLELHESRWCRAVFVLAKVDGSMRERNFDVVFVEALLNQAVESAADLPLLDRLGLDTPLDHNGRVSELI